MPTTLTLKGIPDDLYAKLKRTAEVHRRSLNSEVIHVLETVLLPQRVDVHERLARAQAVRDSLKPRRFSAKEIDQAKRAGRP